MKKAFIAAIINLVAFSVFAQDNCRMYTAEVASPPAITIKAKTLAQRDAGYDMSWLNNAVKGKQMVMIGESHWMSSVQAAAKSILFHLNEIDYFPVLVREVPYSVTPFMNAYINCESGDCDKVLQIIKPYVRSQEEAAFLKELQVWNRTHRDKKITIACSDFEQGFQFPLSQVLHPYFTGVGHTDFRDQINRANSDVEVIFAYIDSLLTEAPEAYAVEGKPYLNKKFVGEVYDNLKSFYQAGVVMKQAMQDGKSEGEAFMEREKIRTASIMKNLTEPSRFGKLISDNKTVLWGGASHVRKYQAANDDFHKYEGWYLANEFAPTKDKVLTVKIMSMSYGIPAAYYTNEGYKNGIGQYERLIEAYKSCNEAKQPDVYKMVEESTDVTNAVTLNFEKNNNQPVWLRGHSEMRRLLKKSPTLLQDNQLKSFYSFDYVIVLPFSLLFSQLEE